MSAQVLEKGRMMKGLEPQPAKVQAVEKIREKLSASSSVVLFDFRGLDVTHMTKLRRQARAAGVDLFVVKNSLLARAIEGTPYEVIRESVEGPISIATTSGDPSAPAKALGDFLKEADSGKILGGALDGRFLKDSEVKELASLPPREVLLSRLAGALQAPVAGLPRVLNGVLVSLLNVLQAVVKNKEER